MSKQEKCQVLDHKQVAPKHFKLTLKSEHISNTAHPGQFVNIRVAEKLDPLLRRPLGLHSVSTKDQSFQVLYEVVGKGTEILSQVKAGHELDVLGPLGNGFTLKKGPAIIIAGGMGVAPLLYLANQLQVASSELRVLIGANTKDKVLCEKEFKEITDNVLIATDDGTYGEKGFVSNILNNLLTTNPSTSLGTSNSQLTTIYSCGPKPMLKAVSQIAQEKNIPCQVSMEAYMACGIGTCLGCVIKTKEGFKRVCKDGPVFDAKELIWTS